MTKSFFMAKGIDSDAVANEFAEHPAQEQRPADDMAGLLRGRG